MPPLHKLEFWLFGRLNAPLPPSPSSLAEMEGFLTLLINLGVKLIIKKEHSELSKLKVQLLRVKSQKSASGCR